MTRVISIVLIVVVALQTVGCSTWRTLGRMDDVSEENRQILMRDQVFGKLKEGMRVKIRVREDAPTPFEGQVIICVIEKVGPTSLAVNLFRSNFHGNDRRESKLRFADIVSIEYRTARGLPVFLTGFAVGVVFVYFAFALPIALSLRL